MTTNQTSDQGAMDRTKQAASTAADEGKHVGAVAKDEAQNVVGTAAQQARSVASETVGQLRDQLTEQGSGQRDRLVGTLRSLGDDLEQMAGQATEGGLAADLVRQAAGRTRSLTERLDGREPAQLLDDVRDFARRRPGTFLLGALAAGVVAGRLLRGAADGAAAAELATPPQPTGYSETGGDDSLSGPASVPSVSSSARPAAPAPSGPPLTPSTHGQPTIGTP